MIATTGLICLDSDLMIIKSGTFLIRSNNLQRRAAHSLKAILSILLVNQLQPKDANLNNFTLLSVLAFVGSVCGFMWYFKNNKPDQYYGNI